MAKQSAAMPAHAAVHPLVRSSLSVIGCAALTALAAQVRIPVPWSDVPMTLQSLVVLVAGFTLSPVVACSGMLLYLGCGAAGLPVFAPGSAGLFGATGGYLVGFVVAAMTISFLRGRHQPSVWRLMLSGSAGLAVLFAFGLAWRYVYAMIFGVDAGSLLAAGVVPFIPKAIVELFLAVSVVKVLPARFSGGKQNL